MAKENVDPVDVSAALNPDLSVEELAELHDAEVGKLLRLPVEGDTALL